MGCHTKSYVFRKTSTYTPSQLRVLHHQDILIVLECCFEVCSVAKCPWRKITSGERSWTLPVENRSCRCRVYLQPFPPSAKNPTVGPFGPFGRQKWIQQTRETSIKTVSLGDSGGISKKSQRGPTAQPLGPQTSMASLEAARLGPCYPLVNVDISMEHHHFHPFSIGKIHYTWLFVIAMFVYRVVLNVAACSEMTGWSIDIDGVSKVSRVTCRFEYGHYVHCGILDTTLAH